MDELMTLMSQAMQMGAQNPNLPHPEAVYPGHPQQGNTLGLMKIVEETRMSQARFNNK